LLTEKVSAGREAFDLGLVQIGHQLTDHPHLHDRHLTVLSDPQTAFDPTSHGPDQSHQDRDRPPITIQPVHR
jgi:hypothetical protein